MKKILLVALVCLSSLSFAAESGQLGEGSPSELCNQAIDDNCKTCVQKHCAGHVKSDRVVKDVGGVKAVKGAKASSTKQ